ncbi:MAG TPA: DUF4173 domain-containing protein [Anaerolineaceae bacterium]|nr:DUF4173 domain-containing protein [Anaerolineaceae bacterium]
MQIKHPYRIALAALFVAWSFDFLFWGHDSGISFPIFIFILAVTGLALAWSEGVRIPPTSLWLLLPTAFFALMSVLRLEPFTTTLNVAISLGSLAILVLTLLGGQWITYSLSDYAAAPFRLAASMLGRVPMVWRDKLRFDREEREQRGETPGKPGALKRSAPVFRGLLLAVPVVAVFSALFAAADPIFAQSIKAIIDFSWLQNLDEALFRICYVLLFAYFFQGLYLHALIDSRQERLIGLDKPWLPAFLGWTESVVLLACVDLLFAFFVGLQVRYFFGGQANIHIEGFTYAEYARRGFGELVMVALFSLALILGLSSVTRRETSRQSRVFSGLTTGLVGLVIVILVSAFQRMALYESAYGFTRVRTYTTVFMVWLGLLLICAALLEIVKRQRAFALACLVALIGFGISLNLLNVDAFIVQQNVAIAVQGKELDQLYLTGLSDDAIEPTVASFHDPALPKEVHDRLGGSLACRLTTASTSEQPTVQPWQAYHPTRARAQALLLSLKDELKSYPMVQDEYDFWQVKINGELFYCFPDHPFD